MERFIPAKHMTIDGKIWWCVFDAERAQFSTYTCHGKYKRKKDCVYSINLANKKYKNCW